MSQPLVIAYHLIWTAYGWWLPNDPRGSGSFTVRTDVLDALGELHHGRKDVQPFGSTIRRFQDTAENLLKHPRLSFDDAAVHRIVAAFANAIAGERYTCYACAIMPDHVHLLIRKHKHQAEQMVENLQVSSRHALIEADFAASTHPIWTAGTGWKVFLEHPDEIRRTIRYIEKNPLEICRPKQQWPFVIPYDGWPLHPGHSPLSPYVKALKAAGRYP
jgi:REP element-mobilizing transposase RayT